MRAVFANIYHMSNDENVQVNGCIYFLDMSNFSLSQLPKKEVGKVVQTL